MWSLHFGGNNLCVQRLACRALSASAELLAFKSDEPTEQFTADDGLLFAYILNVL